MSTAESFRSTLALIVDIANDRQPCAALVLPARRAAPGLKQRDVRLACVTLVDKLWALAMNRRKRTIAMETSMPGDRACKALVECLPILSQSLRVDDRALAIVKGADPSLVRWMLDYIRKEGGTLVMVDPVIPPALDRGAKLPAEPRLWHDNWPPRQRGGTRSAARKRS